MAAALDINQCGFVYRPAASPIARPPGPTPRAVGLRDAARVAALGHAGRGPPVVGRKDLLPTQTP